MQPFKIRLNIENTKLKFHLSLRLFSVKAAANFSQSKKLMIFQDDIALVICMIILMAVTAGVVMFKVNKCFINFNRKVHI